MRKKIVIVGAGVAGLSCAYHLDGDYELYEKEGEPGGLCRSCTSQGFTFDFAGHLLHFKTDYGAHLVKKLLGDNIAHHERHSYVYLNNRFSPYPFQVNTYRLPRPIIKDCLLGFISKDTANGNNDAENFYDWMMKSFGAGVVKHFMLPYNKKFWRLHPRHLNCEWLNGKIPVPSASESIAGAFLQTKKPWGYNARFWYPKKGGIASLVRAFTEHVRAPQCNHEVRRIDLKKRLLVFSNNRAVAFDALVLTLPLAALGSLLHPLPSSVRGAVQKLNYISIINYNLGIRRQRFKRKHWVYYPQDKFLFYRIGSFSSFSHTAAPRGQTALYTEISEHRRTHAYSEQSAKKRIENDLARLNIIRGEGDILARVFNRIKYGYIVYDRFYSKSRQEVVDFLRSNKIYPVGRFGSWRYLTMEESILDGKHAAEQLNRAKSLTPYRPR